MKHHTEDPLCTIKSGNLSGIKVRITSATYFRSLSFSPEALTTDKSLRDSSLCNDGVFTKDTVLKVGSNSSVSVDVHLHGSSSLTGLLDIITKKLGKSLNVLGANQDNSSLSSGIKSTTTVNLEVNYGSLGYDCLLPGRNLTSLQGDVIAVHCFDPSSSDMYSSWKDIDDLGFSDGTQSCCIHVSMTHQSVNAYHNPCFFLVFTSLCGQL